MLEAKLAEAETFRKLLNVQFQTRLSPILTCLFLFFSPAIKELVMDANFECNEEGINLHWAMDNSHVLVVAVKLLANGD